MSLLDRVQRKAEDASPSGGVAGQPAPPPPFALPSAGVPTLASLAPPPSESLAPTPSWSVRTSPANSAPPVAPPPRALEPAQFGRPAPAQAPPPLLRVRPSDTSGLGDANRPTSLLSRTGDSAGCVAAWNAAAERLLGWTEAEARGQRLTELVGGDDRGTRLTRMIAAASEEHTPGRQIVPVKLRRRDGQPLHFEVRAARRQDDLAGALVSFTDVTERWRTEFLKNCQLGFLRALGSPDEHAALLGALEQIGLSVNGTDVRLWEADARGVVRLRAVWSRAGYDPTTEPSTQAVPSALVTRAISSRGLSFSEASPARPVGESLAVPVLNGEHALGAIEIGAPDFAGFDDAQAAHLTGLGNYLGIYCAQRRSAADFARSLEELNRVSGERLRLMRLLVEAHEDERRRIAADIHDDSLQILAAVGLRLHTLRRRVNDEAARSTLGAVEQMVGTAISRLRGLMFNLRPTGLDHGDLLGTIRDRLTQVQQDEGIEYSLTGSEPGALTTAARVTLYRVAQEAIANVVKHAAASHISVSFEERDGGCLMRITDGGAGLGGAAESPPGHLGLPSMRERTEVAGGWLRVEAGAPLSLIHI